MARQVGRIETELILSTICHDNSPINIYYINKKYEGKICSVNGDRAIVEITPPKREHFVVGRKVQLFFMHNEQRSTCVPVVLRDEGRFVHLKTTEGAYEGVEREHERIVGDRSINIKILEQEQEILYYPHSQRNISDDFLTRQTKSRRIDVPTVTAGFHALGTDNELCTHITVFKKAPPHHLCEKVVANIGQLLAIPPTPELYSINGFAGEHDIASAIRTVDPQSTKQSLDVNDKLPKYMECEQQILAPFLFRDYCIGYLLIATKTADKPITEKIIQDLQNFTVLFSVALKNAGYFNSLIAANNPTHQVILVDISSGGLCFQYESLHARYAVGDTINMIIIFEARGADNQVHITVEVLSVRAASRLHTVSVKFMEFQESAQQKILMNLYGHTNDVS